MYFICRLTMGNTLGQLPEGYSKAVHGPYDPSVFYGKKDVPLGQVNIKVWLMASLNTLHTSLCTTKLCFR